MATIPWYEKNMMQSSNKVQFLLLLLLLLPLFPLCTRANQPVHDGFSGAGRAGILREAVFTNPAALALLTGSYGFGYFTKTRLVNLDSGGRDLTVGAMDGDNEYAKAAFAYEREARAGINAAGASYFDRTQMRLGIGRMLTPSLGAGITGKYIVRRNGAAETKKMDGDAGVFYPVMNDMMLGLTYENFVNVETENPTVIGAGVKYNVIPALGLFADAARITKGNNKGKYSWSTAFEVSMMGDLFLRAGLFKDFVNGTKGKSIGLTWAGPRTSFDYSMHLIQTGVREKSQTLGVTFQL